MTRPRQPDDVRPVDAVVGDDGDAPGIAQELTVDDIDDIALDPEIASSERYDRLQGLLEEVRARRAGDLTGDMGAVEDHLLARLSDLDNPEEQEGYMGSIGMDPDDRSDDDDPADHIDDEEPEEDGGP